MSDFEVRGADEFLRLSKALKAAGQGQLRKDLNAAMKRAAKPLIADARQAAREAFPKKGGLNESVARKTKFRVVTRTGDNPGISIGAPRKNVTAYLANRDGRFRHPVHADPTKTRKQWKWVTQPGPRGWFDDAMRGEAPKVRPALEQALEDMAQRIIREVGR